MLEPQVKEYVARAEYLKGVTGQEHGGPENGNATAAQKVKKPGVGGNDNDVSQTKSAEILPRGRDPH